ncbi:MAG: hypothetical protein QXH42_09760 [Thermoplasmata archaeon]
MSATMNPSEPGQEFLFNYAADIRPLITPEYCSEFLLQFETFATWEHAHLMPVCAEYDGPGLRISLPPAEAPSDISSLNFAIFSGTFPRGSSWIWNNGFVGEVSFGGDGVRSELTQTDGKPPEILKVDGSHIQVKVEIIYSYLLPKESKVKITVEAHDAAGLDRFEFILQGEEIKQVFVTDGSLEKTVSVTFTCGVGRALGRGWDLEVKVYDRNGNGNKTSTHIDGALEGVVKALIKAFMALVEAIKELASEVFEWIWGAIKNLINSFLKPIINSIAIWIIQFTNIIKTYFERISKSFICPEGRLDSSNLIDWIEFISATLNWLFLPLMAVTMIITILNIIEIFFGILTFGVTTLSGFMIGRFITCLIISVVGMTIIEATLIMIDPTVEKFMSIAPVFNDIIGIISELATGIGLFLLELKSRSTLWRSAPIAILSIFLTAIAPFFTHGYPLLIMDIIIIIMTIISVYLFFKPLEQAAKTIAPITSTFTDGITVIAWITDPITVASHWEEWWS